MEEERLVSGEKLAEDSQNFSLRPQYLHEYIGQSQLKEELAIYIQAAKQRQEALDHVLLSGPPVLVKTTMEMVIDI